MTDITIPQRALAAEVRAVEAGRLARAQDDGSFLVHSELLDTNYVVTYFGDVTGTVRFTCSCAYGKHHPETAIGCKHMAQAGRSLEWRGLAVHDADGTWRVPGWTAPEPFLDDSDPFFGLPGYTPPRFDPADVAEGAALLEAM